MNIGTARMNRLNICIFGGTTEGRIFAEFISKNNATADLFIATEYGLQFVEGIENVIVHQKRMDENEMAEIFTKNKYDFVVDATHPFASIVSENIVKASEACGMKYLRTIRKSDRDKNCIYFGSFTECVEFLKENSGNVLLTTGSKVLEEFTTLENYRERIFIRILPMESSLTKCIKLGFLNKNIICMQGPFSEELNAAMIRSINAKYMVTKESADSGGFDEKVRACSSTGAQCLVIKRPYEKGYVIEEICEVFSGWLNEVIN